MAHSISQPSLITTAYFSSLLCQVEGEFPGALNGEELVAVYKLLSFLLAHRVWLADNLHSHCTIDIICFKGLSNLVSPFFCGSLEGSARTRYI